MKLIRRFKIKGKDYLEYSDKGKRVIFQKEVTKKLVKTVKEPLVKKETILLPLETKQEEIEQIQEHSSKGWL